MKIIDRDGRLFGKISVIDVLVIAVVAVIAAAVYFKHNVAPTGAGTVEERPIVFQVKVTGTERYIADAIQVGDKIYDPNYSSGGGPVGEITQVEVLNDPGTMIYENLQNGTLVKIEVAGTADLLVTVKGSGVSDGRSYSINRVYDLGINSARTYRSNKAIFSGTVVNILD